MIVINRGQENEFVMTLNDRVTISNPEFLMALYGKSQQPLIKFFLTDKSTSDRYNEFSLVEGTDETIPAGQYTYRVYQKANQDDEDIPSSDNIVEEGILKSVVSGNVEVEYSRNDSSKVYGDED